MTVLVEHNIAGCLEKSIAETICFACSSYKNEHGPECQRLSCNFM
jgi:hypothetical protein